MRNLPPTRSAPQYLTLSYCWGGDVKSKLTRKTYDAMKGGIDVQRLPPNFRDAIRLTRALGYQYIWIDSLCIIQDDQDDWAQESVLIIKVYAHARCTLSATASRTSHGGCIREREGGRPYPHPGHPQCSGYAQVRRCRRRDDALAKLRVQPAVVRLGVVPLPRSSYYAVRQAYRHSGGCWNRGGKRTGSISRWAMGKCCLRVWSTIAGGGT